MKEKREPGRLICLDDPKTPIAEAYRTLRTNIQFAGAGGDLRTLLVTSADPGEGKTTTISNLAVTMAQTGKKVLLLDGDLRKPSLHQVFQLSNRVGLTSLLIREAAVEEAIQPILGSNVDVITSGPIPPNPAELLGSERMTQLIEAFKQQYEYVLFDTSPVLPVTDAQVLARHVDGVVLVLGSGKVLREHAKKAKALLDHVGARVIGAVLNRKEMEKGDYTYYYG